MRTNVWRWVGVMLAIWCAGAAAAQSCGRWLFGPGQERGDLNGTISNFAKWDPDGPGPEGEWLVMVGNFFQYGTQLTCGPVVAWDGGRYRTFGNPAVLASGSIAAVGTVNGQLYIAGSAVSGVRRWTGSAWEQVGASFNGSIVTRLLSFRGDLVAVGNNLPAAGGGSSPAIRFRNGAWEHLGGTSASARGISACVFRDELVIGGVFTAVNGVPALNIAKWDGQSWLALGDGIAGTEVSDVTEHEGRLVAVGRFTASGATSLTNVASWDGASWSPVGELAAFSVLRATTHEGQLHVIDGALRPFRWTGQGWVGLLPSGATMSTPRSGTLVAYQGDLIVGGQFAIASTDGTYLININPIRNLARYTRGTLLRLGLGVPTATGSLIDVTVFNGSLFLAGEVDTASGKATSGVARWDGINLDSMGPLRPFGTPGFLVPWNGRLIAGGPIQALLGLTSSDTVQVQGYIQWDGTKWAPFSANAGSGELTALAIFGSTLTDARQIPVGGVVQWIVRTWNGTVWTQVGGGADARIESLVQFGTSLVAAGSFQNFENKPVARIARWNGSAWEAMGDGFNNTVWALHVHNGELYAAGAFTASGATPVSRIARWDGAAWVAVAEGFNDEVFKLHTHNGELIAGGKFTASGTTGVSRIARLRGGVWTPLGGGLASTGGEVYGLATYRDELIAVGTFARADGQRSVTWARWTDDGVAEIIDQPVGGTYLCGERVVLSARQMNGYTPMRGEWLKDGQPFDFSTMPDVRQIDSGGRSMLIFDRIDARRAGSYACRMVTDCGSVESSAALVSVVDACCPGDINSDGLVDDLDFQLFVQQYAIMDCFDPDMPPLCLADLDLDAFVTDDDFLMFLSGYDAVLCYP